MPGAATLSRDADQYHSEPDFTLLEHVRNRFILLLSGYRRRQEYRAACRTAPNRQGRSQFIYVKIGLGRRTDLDNIIQRALATYPLSG